MVNIVSIAGIERTLLAFRATVLTITSSRLLVSSPYPRLRLRSSLFARSVQTTAIFCQLCYHVNAICLFYILAASKVISRWAQTFDSAH